MPRRVPINTARPRAAVTEGKGADGITKSYHGKWMKCLHLGARGFNCPSLFLRYTFCLNLLTVKDGSISFCALTVRWLLYPKRPLCKKRIFLLRGFLLQISRCMGAEWKTGFLSEDRWLCSPAVWLSRQNAASQSCVGFSWSGTLLFCHSFDPLTLLERR